MNDNALDIHLVIKNRLTAKMIKRHTALSEALESITETARAEWAASGGCLRCNGTGQVLTWSTMDSASYDEHGPCQECTPESRKLTGTNPKVSGPSRSNYSERLDNLQVALEIEPATVNFLLGETKEVENELNVTKKIDKLNYVVVFKGRKVPVGTHGVVVAFKVSQWGTKVCIIDGEGVKHWTDNKNVEGMLTEEPSIKIPAIERFINGDNEFRKSKNAPASPHTVESMLAK